MLKYKLLALTLFLMAIVKIANANENDLPSYRGYVNDFANIIDSSDELTIENLAQEVDNKTTAQIAVVTISTAKPLTIEQYTVELFEKWGIGKKGKDNGLLILMAANDRAVRIETGYGLEGAIPDAIASRIIKRVMIPQFKQGNLSKGLVLGVNSVAQLIAKEYNISLSGLAGIPVAQPTPVFLNFLLTLLLFILIFGMRSGLLFYFLIGSNGRRRGGTWHGTGFGGTSGGFGGGFGGFGGGMSGGGGASGRW